jgi:glutamate-1-semialdehyde 2,1-aminomutase
VEDLEEMQTEFDAILKDLFWFHAIRRGFWIARRGMLALILGTTESELEGFLEFAKEFLQEFQSLMRL